MENKPVCLVIKTRTRIYTHYYYTVVDGDCTYRSGCQPFIQIYIYMCVCRARGRRNEMTPPYHIPHSIPKHKSPSTLTLVKLKTAFEKKCYPNSAITSSKNTTTCHPLVSVIKPFYKFNGFINNTLSFARVLFNLVGTIHSYLHNIITLRNKMYSQNK